MRALYDFQCVGCGEKYEEFAVFDESGVYESVVCPLCGSDKKEKLMTTCAYKFTNPQGTDRWNSEANGHDYRFKFNQPKVAQEREIAAQCSHMGETPYNNIDDITSGKNFGEVR